MFREVSLLIAIFISIKSVKSLSTHVLFYKTLYNPIYIEFQAEFLEKMWEIRFLSILKYFSYLLDL